MRGKGEKVEKVLKASDHTTGLRLKLLTLGVGDNLLLPLTSIPEKENKGGKRLSPTPSVSNLSLRPCCYLSTVTRSSEV